MTVLIEMKKMCNLASAPVDGEYPNLHSLKDPQVTRLQHDSRGELHAARWVCLVQAQFD
jgi:hypothetical protein